MRARRWAAWSGVALLLAFTVVLVGWRVAGGSWVRVETPSMGTAAPVGTLLWVKPVAADLLRVGDLVTFRPPGSQGVTYSHEIRTVHPDGTFSTQGRLTAPDPWRITAHDIVGKALLRMPGAGWLVLVSPILGLGGLLVWLVTSRLHDRDLRLPVVVVGASVVLAVALLVHQPLTRAERISFVPDDAGARATYVSTGLLPVQLSAPGAETVVLTDGEVGSVLARRGTDVAAGQQFTVVIRPAVPWSWWVVLAGCCFVPAIVGSLGRRRRRLKALSARSASLPHHRTQRVRSDDVPRPTLPRSGRNLARHRALPGT